MYKCTYAHTHAKAFPQEKGCTLGNINMCGKVCTAAHCCIRKITRQSVTSNKERERVTRTKYNLLMVYFFGIHLGRCAAVLRNNGTLTFLIRKLHSVRVMFFCRCYESNEKFLRGRAFEMSHTRDFSHKRTAEEGNANAGARRFMLFEYISLLLIYAAGANGLIAPSY